MENDSDPFMVKTIPMTMTNDKKVDNYHEPAFGSFLRFLGCCFGYSCGLTACPCCCYPYKTINRGCKGVIQEFGRFEREVSDGMYYVNPITEKLTTVDMKLQVIDLGKQHVMTLDNLSIDIFSVVYYKIINATDVLFNVNNSINSITELSHTSLRDVIGKSTLQQCLASREDIANEIKSIVDKKVHNWGVHIESVLIKSIDIPNHTAEQLSAAAIARREAEAKLITADANVIAAKKMNEAAMEMSNSAAMQVRVLEVWEKLANSENTKILIMPPNFDMNDVSKMAAMKEIV